MSAELLAVLLFISGGLLLWSVLRARRLSARLRALDTQLQRAEALGQEQAARLAALETLRDSQQLAEHAVATGTAVVKEVHKGIANIPFSVLEAIPATRAPAMALRGLHDSISDGVYGALAGLNKAVGRELRKGVPLVDVPASHTAAPEEPAASLPSDPAPSPARENDDAAPPSPSPKNWG